MHRHAHTPKPPHTAHHTHTCTHAHMRKQKRATRYPAHCRIHTLCSAARRAARKSRAA